MGFFRPINVSVTYLIFTTGLFVMCSLPCRVRLQLVTTTCRRYYIINP